MPWSWGRGGAEPELPAVTPSRVSFPPWGGPGVMAGGVPRGFRLLFQSKLVKYFSRQLSCKRKVALQERNAKLEGFPQLLHWFRIVDIRKEVMEVRDGHQQHRSRKGPAAGLGAEPLR